MAQIKDQIARDNGSWSRKSAPTPIKTDFPGGANAPGSIAQPVTPAGGWPIGAPRKGDAR